jgi:hypothetical protein
MVLPTRLQLLKRCTTNPHLSYDVTIKSALGATRKSS